MTSGAVRYQVHQEQMIPIPNLQDWYPDLHFNGRSELIVTGQSVLVTDPIYLADVFNKNDDTVAAYIRKHGITVSDFGGDCSCPIYWNDPYLVLPTSASIDPNDFVHLFADAEVLAEEVGCDSAAFIFLCMTDDIPIETRSQIDTVVQDRNGALLHLPDGRYSFFLQQFAGYPQANMAGLYRSIVAVRHDLDS